MIKLIILSVFIIASLMIAIPTVYGAKIITNDDNWYRYSVVGELITIEYLFENKEGAIEISIADPLQGCGQGILVHEDWDFVGSDPRIYEIERGIMYHVYVAGFTIIDGVNTEYTHQFCFDITDDVDFISGSDSITVNMITEWDVDKAYQLFDNCNDDGTKIESKSKRTKDNTHIFTSLNPDTFYRVHIIIYEKVDGKSKPFAINECVLTLSDTTLSNNKKSNTNSNFPPTLGVNKDGKRLVESGFSYNGNFINAEYYHTAYPLITTNIGDKNIVEIIVYDDRGLDNIQWVQLFLGVEKVGKPTNLSEVIGQLILSNGEFKEFNIIDKQNLIQNFDVASIEPVKCKANSNSKECLKITFEYEYREAPLYNVIAVSLMDNQRNSWTYFFNDGVEVIGESLNPADTIPTFRGIFTQDKINEIWTDEDGVEYEKNKFDSFKRITPYSAWECNDTPLDEIKNGGDRNNCHWRSQLISMWK